uniref:Uncharacterized protein n=1 Tax=Eptatretus burgeri TaxID=7764 RepID=A0A8C4Q5A4_EPTBU
MLSVQVYDKRMLLIRLSNDLQTCMDSLQEPNVLHAHLKEMYAQYPKVRCHEWKYHPEDEEKAELGRQRQFLERSLASRLPLLLSDATSSHSEALHTLKENVDLIHKISELRKELHAARLQNKSDASIQGMSRFQGRGLRNFWVFYVSFQRSDESRLSHCNTTVEWAGWTPTS